MDEVVKMKKLSFDSTGDSRQCAGGFFFFAKSRCCYSTVLSHSINAFLCNAEATTFPITLQKPTVFEVSYNLAKANAGFRSLS